MRKSTFFPISPEMEGFGVRDGRIFIMEFSEDTNILNLEVAVQVGRRLTDRECELLSDIVRPVADAATKSVAALLMHLFRNEEINVQVEMGIYVKEGRDD